MQIYNPFICSSKLSCEKIIDSFAHQQQAPDYQFAGDEYFFAPSSKRRLIV